MSKEVVLNTCRNIVYRWGLQHLLMDEVAKQSGMSKKTVYELFGSKEALIEHLGEIFLDQEAKAFYTGIRQTHDLQERALFIIKHLLDLSRLIPYDQLDFLKKKHRINYQMLQQYVAEVAEKLEETLLAGKENAEVYPAIDVSTQTKLLLAQLRFLHTETQLLLQEKSREHWQRHITHNFLRSTFITPSLMD